jgi:hypothetical protein
MLTLNAEPHLEETLLRWYEIAPIRRLLVSDGGSKDKTLEILNGFPRVELFPATFTTGKAFENLKNMVGTPWFIWIDVGKLPDHDWFDEMMRHKDRGEFLNSKRYNYDGRRGLYEDKTIRNPCLRPLGGSWLLNTKLMEYYHVDDDYAQRNFDIIIKMVVEEHGGRYFLVDSTSSICYLPIPITDKKILEQRHVQNAKGIIKYISPDYAKEHASYLLNDHWMYMMNNIPREWVELVNPIWAIWIEEWRRRKTLYRYCRRLLEYVQ